MTDELELVRGTDNPFRDAGLPEPDTKLMKAGLAAEIIRILRGAKHNRRESGKAHRRSGGGYLPHPKCSA